MKDISKIIINKNRGWRGLAEIKCYTEDGKLKSSVVFSFSQDMWDDLLDGSIVIADTDNYYVINFDNLVSLPRKDQQRSVLIKNFQGNVLRVNTYDKATWTRSAMDNGQYSTIANYRRNRNNHTTSDWNCIGIRVMPEI